MLNKIFAFRYISWIAVIGSMLGSFLMFIVGGYKTYLAFVMFFSAPLTLNQENNVPLVNRGNHAMATLVSAMDIFLFALVLLIFGYGIYNLFISSMRGDKEIKLPGFMRIENLSQLKATLAEVIVIILFVDFLESVINEGTKWVPWEGVVTPVAILLLAGAFRLMQTKE